MALVFGNQMADAVAKQAASEAALRGAAAEQISWVDALAWQVQRRIVEANLQASKTTPTVLASREKGLRRETVQNSSAVSFRTSYTPIGISAIKAKVGMPSLQAEHVRNVVGTLVKGRPLRRRTPDHAEY